MKIFWKSTEVSSEEIYEIFSEVILGETSCGIFGRTSITNSVNVLEEIYGAISVANHEIFVDKFVKESMWELLGNLGGITDEN